MTQTISGDVPAINKNSSTGNGNLLFLIFPSILVVLLIAYSFKESSSVRVFNNPVGTNDIENNTVISPSANQNVRKEPIEKIISEKSFRNSEYVENLFRDWNSLFDLFASNSNFRQNAKNINVRDLERITDKIQNVSKEFKLGNVDNLVKELGDVIKTECNLYNIDWRLILAIIRQESYFNANARSHAGAFGLMQLMLRTGESLQNTLELENTKDPRNNLIAGIYYYAALTSQFREFGDEKYKFALAAYNAGIGRVIDAMTITAYFGKDYKQWDNVKEAYPFLSSKEDSIHALVWTESKRPTYGSLDNWKEPYNYVNSIMFYYDAYKNMFESNLKEPEPVQPSKKKSKKK